MGQPKRQQRSLANVRTQSGRIDADQVTYKAYMRLSTLELEKARRSHERACAVRRIEGIDERIQQIELEKAKALRMLSESAAANPGVNLAVPPPSMSGPVRQDAGPARTSSAEEGDGFRFKY